MDFIPRTSSLTLQRVLTEDPACRQKISRISKEPGRIKWLGGWLTTANKDTDTEEAGEGGAAAAAAAAATGRRHPSHTLSHSMDRRSTPTQTAFYLLLFTNSIRWEDPKKCSHARARVMSILLGHSTGVSFWEGANATVFPSWLGIRIRQDSWLDYFCNLSYRPECRESWHSKMCNIKVHQKNIVRCVMVFGIEPAMR